MNTNTKSLSVSKPILRSIPFGGVAFGFLLFIVFSLGLVHAQQYATNILYQDEFTGSGPLDGRVPDTATINGTNAWLTANDGYWTVNGNDQAICSVGEGNNSPGAFLPFTPTAGSEYLLSATLDDPAGGTAWIALGFAVNDNAFGESGDWLSSYEPVGWILATPDNSGNDDQAFSGPATLGTHDVFSYAPTGPTQYAVLMNLTNANSSDWTFTWYINGSAVATNPAVDVSSIAYVALEDWYDTDVTASNFVLEQIYTATPVSIVTQPQLPALTFFTGQAESLSVVASGSPPLSYQWQMISGGVTNNIPGATSSTLILNNLAVTNSGNYQVIVSNPVGSTNSIAASLQVVVPAVTTTLYHDKFSGSSGEALDGWTPDTADINNNTWLAENDLVWTMNGSGQAVGDSAGDGSTPAAFLPFTPSAGSAYYLSATLDDPDANGNDNWLGLGFTESGATTDYGDDYAWINADDTLDWIFAATDGSGSYDQAFSGPDVNGFIDTGYYPNGPAQYGVWLNLTSTNTADWTCVFTINGSFVASTSASDALSINYAGICNWQDYGVTVSNFVLQEFYLPSAPTIVTQPQLTESPLFVGEPESLSVLAIAAPAPTYQWEENNVAIPGATSATLTFNDLAVTNSGNYQVIVSNSLGSVTSIVASVQVYLPVATATLYQDKFTGTNGSLLDGRTPDTADINGNTWITADDGLWTINGTNQAVGAGAGSTPGAFLPFTPTAGNAYYLSATLDDPAGGAQWIAFGFPESIDSDYGEDNNWLNIDYPLGWMLVRPDNSGSDDLAWQGPSTYSGSIDTGVPPTGPAQYAALMDLTSTNSANWIFLFYINGSVVTSTSASSALSINYVALEDWQDSGVTASNFLLQQVAALPSNLQTQFSNGILTVSWTGSGTLLQSTSLLGPWTPAATTSPYVVNTAANKQMFYRLQN